MAVKPFAFVLMPFDGSFQDTYKLGIQAAATECGVIAERVDEQIFSETMLERIYRQIEAADFIIADMSGRNPNVFYEVGYAHARGKLCTLLTKTADDIPFDLKHHRHIIYDGSIKKLKDSLKLELEWLKNQSSKEKSSAFTIELPRAYGSLDKSTYYANADVELTFDITNKSERKSPDIEAMYIYTSNKWAFKQDGNECPSQTSIEGKTTLRHFIRAPTTRLSPGMWAQVKLSGRCTVWSKFSGEELLDKYNLTGSLIFEISTSEGSIKEEFNLNIEAEDLPF